MYSDHLEVLGFLVEWVSFNTYRNVHCGRITCTERQTRLHLIEASGLIQ